MTAKSFLPGLATGAWRRRVARVLALAFAGVLALGAAQAQDTSEIVDPPARVGTLSLLAGPVTLVDLQTGERQDAVLNWPITGGWRLETGHLARAEVRIGSTALRLDDDTTVDFARLDDRFMQIAVLRGAVALRLRSGDVLPQIELLTQRERIVFDDVGRYRIDVDRIPEQTAVTAFSGHARITSGENTFVVVAGSRGEVTAPPMIQFRTSAALSDRFDEWAAARDAQDDQLRSYAYVSREATGIEDLDHYGDWRTVEDYGTVWFPRTLPPDWAPYRYGRWAWIDPWGWTWIDEAPWGFTPFHYGRWVVVGGTWGWVPGAIVPQPVYAPALVAWFGQPGISVSIGAPIGWFPLGPREVYVPPYRHSPRYLRVVNVQNVPDVARITIVQTPRYVNRIADRTTWLPRDRFGRPGLVDRDRRPPPSEWRQYIANPRPPANVPNTKRRQEEAPMVSTPRVRPGTPAGESAARPPRLAPRAEEPRRAIEVPRARPVPPASRPPAPQERREAAPAGRDDRRFAPRAPAPVVPPPAAPPADRARPREAERAPPRESPSPVPRGRGEFGVISRPAPRVAPPPPPPPPPVPARESPAAAPAPPRAGGREREAAPPRPAPRQSDRGDDRFQRPSGRPQPEMAR